MITLNQIFAEVSDTEPSWAIVCFVIALILFCIGLWKQRNETPAAFVIGGWIFLTVGLLVLYA